MSCTHRFKVQRFRMSAWTEDHQRRTKETGNQGDSRETDQGKLSHWDWKTSSENIRISGNQPHFIPRSYSLIPSLMEKHRLFYLESTATPSYIYSYALSSNVEQVHMKLQKQLQNLWLSKVCVHINA